MPRNSKASTQPSLTRSTKHQASGHRAEPRLTAKQKKFADTLLAEPKISKTKAAMIAYGSPDKLPTYASAQQIGYDNMRKPNVLQYLQMYSPAAEQTLYQVMEASKKQMDSSPAYAGIAVKAATEILDRTVGKPQSIQQVTQVGSINIQFGNGQ